MTPRWCLVMRPRADREPKPRDDRWPARTEPAARRFGGAGRISPSLGSTPRLVHAKGPAAGTAPQHRHWKTSEAKSPGRTGARSGRDEASLSPAREFDRDRTPEKGPRRA